MGALRRIKTKRRTRYYNPQVFYILEIYESILTRVIFAGITIRSELISNPPNTSRSTKPPRTPRIYQDSESITALSAQNGLRVNITWLPTRRVKTINEGQ